MHVSERGTDDEMDYTWGRENVEKARASCGGECFGEQLFTGNEGRIWMVRVTIEFGRSVVI